MYGSSTARAMYGMGDYQSRSGYAGGYYAAGGFFSGLKKLAGGAFKAATSSLGKTLIGAIPGFGAIPTVVGALQGIGKAAGMKPPNLKAAITGAAGGGIAKLPFSMAAGVAKRSSRRKRTSSRRRKAAPRSRRRSKRGQGDYGDDWKGNQPSFTKHGHRFLTRAGGRHHRREPPRRKRRRGSRRPGTKVSFTTKDGRHVSFTAR